MVFGRLWYNFLYFQLLVMIPLGSNIVIKDVDEAVYRSLKGEAVKAGVKNGEAASPTFRLLVQQRSFGRGRDRGRMRRAGTRNDEMRRKNGPVESWNSTQGIRKWGEIPQP